MKKQRNGKFKVRPVGDDFSYVQTKLDTPEAFRRRMTDRAIVAVWDEAHQEYGERAIQDRSLAGLSKRDAKIQPLIQRRKV